jgi:hypothetical protein
MQACVIFYIGLPLEEVVVTLDDFRNPIKQEENVDDQPYLGIPVEASLGDKVDGEDVESSGAGKNGFHYDWK